MKYPKLPENGEKAKKTDLLSKFSSKIEEAIVMDGQSHPELEWVHLVTTSLVDENPHNRSNLYSKIYRNLTHTLNLPHLNIAADERRSRCFQFQEMCLFDLMEMTQKQSPIKQPNISPEASSILNDLKNSILGSDLNNINSGPELNLIPQIADHLNTFGKAFYDQMISVLTSNLNRIATQKYGAEIDKNLRIAKFMEKCIVELSSRTERTAADIKNITGKTRTNVVEQVHEML